MFNNLLRRLSGAATAPQPAPADGEDQARQWIAEGNAAEDAGRIADAIALYERAVARAPQLPAAHLNLGLGRAAAGDLAGAERCYEHVLSLAPDHAFCCYNYASLCYRRGELERAAGLVQRAIRAKPDFHQAHLLQSNILDDQGQADAAILAAREALRLAPDFAGAHHNLALLLQGTRQFEEALVAERQAVALEDDRPEFTALHSELLSANGFMVEALAALRASRRLGNRTPLTASSELFFSNFDEDADPADLFALHREQGRLLEAEAEPFRFVPDPAQKERRLRIGYVSGDFRAHAVAVFMLPVLQHHDRAAFEVFCYVSGEKRDHITGQLRSLADHWHDVNDLDDAALAQRVHDDRIDILVDLSGHSGFLRLGVFARKPAPVQVTWLGYLNTTGLTRMDYRLCDERTDPPAQAQALHTERLLYLPHSQWCYRPFMAVPAAGQPPVLANGFITFGSFNQATKVTTPMVRRWGAILARVPGSRLLLADVSSRLKREDILARLQEAGVAPERVEFLPRTDVESYYRLFDRVDIALDTHPYGGGTTTFDALAHGVPVLTAPGATSFSRSAASILQALDLQEWVADGIGAYVDLAVRRAADVATIARLRRELPGRLAASPMMDEPRFVRDLERLLRQAWREYCDRPAA